MNRSYKNLKYFLIIGMITITAVIIISIKQAPKDNSNLSNTIENENKTDNVNDTNNLKADSYMTTDASTLDSEQQTTNTTNSDVETNNTKEIKEQVKKDIDTVINSFYEKPNKINKDIIAGSSEKEKKEIIDSILKKREGIEEFKNLNSYYRVGLDESSYVVFITYDMKFKNIKTLAPGMSVLYILQNEDKNYEIIDNIDDKAINDYVIQLTSEDEIKELINTVNTKLKDAMDSDKELKSFVETLESVSE